MSAIMIVQFLVLTFIVSGVILFFLHRTLISSTEGAVHRLNSETEQVRAKQSELTEKIKQANEELEKRKKEAQELANKMTLDAEEKAKEEREKLVNKARAEGEEIIAKAQRTKDQIRAVIQKDLEIKLIDTCVDIISATLSDEAQGGMDEQLAKEFNESVRKVEMDMVAPDISTAEVVTARTINPAVVTELAAIIKQKLNRDINITTSIDPKLVAGLVLKFGSLTLDGSLQNLLKEKSTQMKEKIERS